MNKKVTWFEAFSYLGIGVASLAILSVMLAFSNPKIESQCAAKGGQVLVRPGHLSSCLYTAK